MVIADFPTLQKRDNSTSGAGVVAALFHLADCYRKQGKSEQAIAAYKRVVQEFPDQIKLADASRNYLSKTFGISQDQASASKTSERQSTLAREKYRKLLEEEIRLVEMQMSVLDKQLQIGTVNPEGPEIYSAKRELVELQQRLAAFDAGIIQLPATPTSGKSPLETGAVRTVHQVLPFENNVNSSDVPAFPNRRTESKSR